METLVELQHVTRRYGRRTVVDDVCLQAGRGEFFSILGSSGCGKSTTLRMIAGFETPDSGSIVFPGAADTKTPAFVSQVNMVFQNYALFPHLSVAENVGFGLKMQRMNRADRERRVLAMLDLVQLRDFAARMPAQLSGGQQQRVALARALATEPAAVLLDEPLGALDLKLRREMQHEMKRIQEDRGLTFIYVTHDQEEALTMSGRICIMHEGRAIQTGTPREIYDQPQTRFVAGFIGESNFLTGRITHRAAGMVTVETACGPVRAAAENPRAEEVTIAIRPARLTLRNAAAVEEENALPGIVQRSVFCGSERLLHVLLTDGTECKVRAPAADSAAWQRGDAVRVCWPVDAGTLLEA